MATLDDIIREQNTIHEELERIAADPDTTEEKDGNMRDTLVSRWKELDEDRAKIVTRMEELELIRKAAADPANREGGADAGPGRWEGRSPQFMMRPDPFEGLDQVKRHLVTGSDMVARAQTAIEYCNRASRLPDTFAEEATRKVTENPQIARHVLIYGGDEYYDTFRAVPQRPHRRRPAAGRRRPVDGPRPGRVHDPLHARSHDRAHHIRHDQPVPAPG